MANFYQGANLPVECLKLRIKAGNALRVLTRIFGTQDKVDLNLGAENVCLCSI